jgi:DNA-binding beta-propeller fold protein YncE
MEILDSVLYVSCNNHDLVGIHLDTRQILLSLRLSSSGLHGITADTAGYLYVADWALHRIYKVDPVDSSFTTLTSVGLYRPSGLAYDAANHRVIVVSFGGNRDIQAVDCETGMVSTVLSTTFPEMDDVCRDQFGNYYITVRDAYHNWIYRFDSTFSAPPDTIVANSNTALVDVCYNRRDNMLGYTAYLENTVTFKQMMIGINLDRSYGWVPLDVQLTGLCDREVTSWSWDLGYGTASGEIVDATYEEPGIYPVALHAATADGDTLLRTLPIGVVALADTVKAPDTTVSHSGAMEVTVEANNTIPLWRIMLPVSYGGDLGLVYDSFSTVGCRTAYFEEQAEVHVNPAGSQVTIKLMSSWTGASAPLEAGSGPIIRLFFRVPSAANGATAVVNMSGYGYYAPEFSGMGLSFAPAIESPTMTWAGCCIGTRGDVNADGGVNISDLAMLVTWMFRQGAEPDCMEAADIDGSGSINVSDISFMVSFLFRGGPSPADCG